MTFAQSESSRTDTDSTTHAEATLDGVPWILTKNGNDGDKPQIKKTLETKGMEPIPKTGNTVDPPHAEDKIIHAYYQLAKKPKRLSIRIDRAPCSRCAANLARLKKLEGIEVRVKASQCRTADQQEGLVTLRDAGIEFRFWTTEAREEKFQATTAKMWEEKRGNSSTLSTLDKYNRAEAEKNEKDKDDLAAAQRVFGYDVHRSFKLQKQIAENCTPFYIDLSNSMEIQ